MTNRTRIAFALRIPEVGEVCESVFTRLADSRRPRPDVAVDAPRRGEDKHCGVPAADAHEGEDVEVPVPVAGHVREPQRHLAS